MPWFISWFTEMTAWKAIGIVGQIVFGSRFFVQWWMSERAGLLLCRWRRGWFGRRFALGAVGAFAFLILTFWGTNLLSTIHNSPAAARSPVQ